MRTEACRGAAGSHCKAPCAAGGPAGLVPSRGAFAAPATSEGSRLSTCSPVLVTTRHVSVTAVLAGGKQHLVTLMCISLRVRGVQRLSTCSSAVHASSLEITLFRSSASFYWVVFRFLNCNRSFYKPDTSSLSGRGVQGISLLFWILFTFSRCRCRPMFKGILLSLFWLKNGDTEFAILPSCNTLLGGVEPISVAVQHVSGNRNAAVSQGPCTSSLRHWMLETFLWGHSIKSAHFQLLKMAVSRDVMKFKGEFQDYLFDLRQSEERNFSTCCRVRGHVVSCRVLLGKLGPPVLQSVEVVWGGRPSGGLSPPHRGPRDHVRRKPPTPLSGDPGRGRPPPRHCAEGLHRHYVRGNNVHVTESSENTWEACWSELSPLKVQVLRH